MLIIFCQFVSKVKYLIVETLPTSSFAIQDTFLFERLMETPTAIKQASPGQLRLSHSSMMKVVRINVGGEQYKVSRSLFDLHPKSMLAQSVSEQWMSDPEEELVFIERDGHQFRFVLDYLRGDGHVILPMTVPKPLFLADLAYYGIENVDASKIT